MQRELREAGMGDMMRVGLNSGDVLYRTIASDLGLEIDGVGPVVHVAARMEQMAPPGSVYLTGETQALRVMPTFAATSRNEICSTTVMWSRPSSSEASGAMQMPPP